MFLTNADLRLQIKNADLDKFTATDTTIIERAERIAIEEMTSYLSMRYDTSIIFKDVLLYNASTIYTKNDRIYTEDSSGNVNYYIINVANTAGQSLDTFTTAGDNRNSLIVAYAIDIILYHIFSAVYPRNIPELRIDRYKSAISWLKMVQQGTLNPSLPVLDAATAGNSDMYRFYSYPKFNTRNY